MIPTVRCLLHSNMSKGSSAVARRSIPNWSRNLSVLAAVDWANGKPRFEVRTGIHEQQIRYRRHDRASAFTKPRPKTKKQRQAYNRKMKRLEDERAKHSAPGAKAGPRRQFLRERWQQLLDHADQKGGELAVLGQEEEYGIEDALIEDIMGNTAHLTSQPTPEPVYLGHRHKHYYNIVADQMDAYREAIDARRAASTDDDTRKDHELLPLDIATAELPSDESISKVMRAYRDRHGTRNKPIGIALALEHLLKDLGVPTMAFGEKTFTTLMTCCRTPKEGRRIIKLMHDRQHAVSAYSWSILVDIHSKLGDFEGCVNVIKEMAMEGTPPTQAAYTSLMAACYKVCNDGRIPHAIRAKAGKVGWENWQEMRIIGIEADAMAYGAIIRLCAARGQAERAINLLEEMQRFDVKPTTLCFSSALKAVARSHEIGVRFERGASRKQLRREQFAAHHGNMARQIVIMAESAEVEQDESFVSALMLCAAAAGDSATAKAVFLASEIRKMDHLRTIGSDGHLGQLRGESNPESQRNLSFTEQELLSADGGLGESANITEIENSKSQQDRLPQVYQREINSLPSFGEREYGKDTRVFSALLRSCGHALNDNGLGTIWAGRQNNGYLCENSLRLITTRWEPSYTPSSIPSSQSSKVGIAALRRYDEDGRDEDRKKGAARKKFRGLYLDDDGVETIDDYAHIHEEVFNEGADLAFLERRRKSDEGENSQGMNRSYAFDIEPGMENSSVSIASQPQNQNDSAEFSIFFEELREEAMKSGLDEEPSEEDARELFEMMKEEFENSPEFENLFENDRSVSIEENEKVSQKKHLKSASAMDMETSKTLGGLEESPAFNGKIIPELLEVDNPASVGIQMDSEEGVFLGMSSDEPFGGSDLLPTSSGRFEEGATDSFQIEFGDLDDVQLEKIAELQEALPGMPMKRLRKVLNSFESTLTLPSMLTLVPILRETLPDHLSSGLLKKINTRTAEFAFQKAKEDNAINGPLLNAMLEVKTGTSALDAAEKFHAEEYGKYKLRPTAFSDRLVFQMFLANNRLQRALAFKYRIENERRALDIPSYGSLVDYYARHNQLGSAMLALRECIRSQGAPPSEKYLTSVRLLYRQNGMHHDELHRLIGQDPTEWLKYGERHLKRERSKKGRRNVRLAML